MFEYIIYIIVLLRLKWILFRQKRPSRFNNYTPNASLANPDQIGLTANQSDWHYSTPNLERKENISLVASNTIDGATLNVQLKWRPSAELKVTTLLSRLSFEIGAESYDYDSIQTYVPTKSPAYPDRITQYGANGSCLKLYVLNPYRQYRIVFRGYMRKRHSPTDELCFVRINLLAFQTSRLYDFNNQLNARSLASQVAAKRPKCGLNGALNELVLHDRHEQTVRLEGEYTIHGLEGAKTKDKLYLWGFHSRHFITEDTQRFRSKRILGHFANGRAFHLGTIEDIANNFDPSQQFSFGYVCFRIGAAVGPTGKSLHSIAWDQVTSSTRKINFDVSGQGWTFSVEASLRDQSSGFMTMTLGSTIKGWGTIVINDSFDSAGELYSLEASLREYKRALAAGELVDPELFSSAKEFDSTKPLIVGIDDSECLYSSLTGAKASSLAQLRALSSSAPAASGPKFTVPRAIVLTRFAYETIKEENSNLASEIKQLEAQVGRGQVAELTRDCERLQKLFEAEARLPAQLRTQLGRQMVQQFNISDLESLDGRSFAARSSSWGEDEDDMSAAGQLSTVLSVKGFEALVAAVISCYSSKFNHTNIEYKRQHGLPLDLPMAVVVQEMVECDKAGVLFTCDPTTGDVGRLMITANYGLGESVLGAKTDPDTISVRVGLRQVGNGLQLLDEPSVLSIEEVKVGEKKVILNSNNVNGHQSPGGAAAAENERADMVAPANGDNENENQQHTQQYDRSRCCLSDQEALAAAQCGVHLARYFQSARDIEWGFKGDQLYLFQSRPVTGLDAYTETELLHEADMPSRGELEFYTRANVGEVMPYAASPLCLTFAMKMWPVVSTRFFTKLKTTKDDDYTLDYTASLAVIMNHAFFPLRGGALINLSGGKERSLISRAMEVGMFGHEVDDQELYDAATDMAEKSKRNKLLDDWRFDYHTFRYRFMPFQLVEKTKRLLFRLRRDVHSMRLSKSGASLEGLFEQIRMVYTEGEQTLMFHVAATMTSSKHNFALLQLLAKYIKDPTQLYAAFAKFLACSPDVLSAEIPRRIGKMSKLVHERGPKDIEMFVGMSPKEGLKYVSADLKSELAKEFDEFMVKFGHRCYNEFEIGELAWRDTPGKIVEMLQTNVKRYTKKGGNSSNAEAADEAAKKITTTEEVIKSLGVRFSVCDRLRLRYKLAPSCQKFISLRERTKDAIIEFKDVVRDACRLLATELRQNNYIPDEELVFFFFYRELEVLAQRGPQPALVAQALRRRRMFKTFKDTAWRFDEIIRGHDVVPLHMKPSKELDEKLANAPKLVGTTASSGKARGKVCLVHAYEELDKVEAGDILVTHSTDIAFSPIFPLLAGVVTEVGGLISHGAVVAREYGIPSVIGIANITKILKHGEEIILDAENGAIIRLSLDGENGAN